MSKLLHKVILIFLILREYEVESANILAIFPVPVRSHFVMIETVLKGLASKGHNVDLFTIFSEKKNISGINWFHISNIDLYDTPLTVTDLRSISTSDMISLMFEEEDGGNSICRDSFQNKIIQSLRDTSKKKYDLILLEMFVYDCFFGFAHIYKKPIIAMTSSVNLPWGAYKIGNPDNPSYIPTYFSEYGDDMTLFERIKNAYLLILAKYKHESNLQYQEMLAREFFGDDMPSLNDLISNTSLFLVNSHFSLNQARPNVPNFIEIAGVHIKEPEKLSTDLKDFIGKSKFIYFSFGSIAKAETLSLEILQNICDIFEKLKYKVLWKANKEELPKEIKVPKNVLMKSWMPQLDILCHPNIILFLSHSGLMGTQEAVYCGVPILSVPMFADQFLNAKNIETKGIGLVLNIETASKDDIEKLMRDLIEDQTYMENVKKLSEQFKERPRKPLDEAIYWIEYVLKFDGASQLKCKSVNLLWYQYYLLDILFIIISILSVIFFVIYMMIRFFSTYSVTKSENKIKKN